MFEYLVIPFGLTNVPTTLQEIIDTILREFIKVFIKVYIDDVLIYSNTWEEYI